MTAVEVVADIAGAAVVDTVAVVAATVEAVGDMVGEATEAVVAAMGAADIVREVGMVEIIVMEEASMDLEVLHTDNNLPTDKCMIMKCKEQATKIIEHLKIQVSNSTLMIRKKSKFENGKVKYM